MKPPKENHPPLPIRTVKSNFIAAPHGPLIDMKSQATSDLKMIFEYYRIGGFNGLPESASAAISRLLEIAHGNIGLEERFAGLAKSFNAIDKKYEELRKNFPGPECESCTCEMELHSESAFPSYYCPSCFYGEGCTFHLGHPPCGWCEHLQDADEHMFGAERNKPVNKTGKENGPSAAMAAKPVTPKVTVTCQGDWWDGLENL